MLLLTVELRNGGEPCSEREREHEHEHRTVRRQGARRNFETHDSPDVLEIRRMRLNTTH